MERFAFVLHPLSLEDMQMVSPMVRYVPDFLLEYILKQKKPFTVSHITGVKSPHAEAEGWFVGCPLTAKQMVELPEEFVIDRIVETGKIAEELGAKILGLGAFTSIVGDAGVTIAERLNIAVTSGNSYTVATALEGTREAARLMGKDLRDAEVAIVGASGSIGSACSVAAMARPPTARPMEMLRGSLPGVRRDGWSNDMFKSPQQPFRKTVTTLSPYTCEMVRQTCPGQSAEMKSAVL